MNTNGHYPLTQDDPLWAAFCYASGELPPAECETFEARLAVEQPLREQLARAVQVLEAIRLAEEHPAVNGALQAGNVAATVPSPSRDPASRRSARLRRRLLWAAAAAAAVSVAFVTGVRISDRLQPARAPHDVANSKPSDAIPENRAAGELISLWAQSWSETAAIAESDNTATEQAFAAVETSRRADLDPSVAIDEAGQEFVVPGWMLAAVSGAAAENSDDPAPEHTSPSDPY